LKIGIFWFYNNKVIGVSHKFSFTDSDSLGMIDSPYDHISYWNKLRKEYPELQEIEYDEIPRGRIIFDINKQKSIIYLDKKLLKKECMYKICDFFNSENESIILRLDSHYRT